MDRTKTETLDDDANTFKILIATDIHLGYAEKHPVKANDSFTAFEEILEYARDLEVDFILLGGDLFHENKPSRLCMQKCMQLLREYCLGDREIAVEFLSDPTINFRHSMNPGVNYEDPNINIGMPVFSIHGNHDDPCGLGQYSSLDLLSTAGLVNYFGKWTDLTHIEVWPLLMQKGKAKLAIYGLSSLKDERLYRLINEKHVEYKCPIENTDDWFNLLVLHQNRARHGLTSFVPETSFPDIFDLIFWGHEHDCRIDPECVGDRKYRITQPGSSVVTQLTPGEAIQKNVGLLRIRSDKSFSIEKLPLKTSRPFVHDHIALEECFVPEHLRDSAADLVKEFVREKLGNMILEAKELETGHPRQPTLPLIRARLEYSEDYQLFNHMELVRDFENQIANPQDCLKFVKTRIGGGDAGKKTTLLDEDALFNVAEDEMADLVGGHIEDFVDKYFEETGVPLSMLGARGLGEAVRAFIEKDDKDSVTTIWKHQKKKTEEYLMSHDVGLSDHGFKEGLEMFKAERETHKEQDVAEAREVLHDPSRVSTLGNQDDSTEMDGIHGNFEDEFAVPPPTPAAARGIRGSKARASRARASPRTGRGRARGSVVVDSDDDDNEEIIHEEPHSVRGRGRGGRRAASSSTTTARATSRSGSASQSGRSSGGILTWAASANAGSTTSSARSEAKGKLRTQNNPF